MGSEMCIRDRVLYRHGPVNVQNLTLIAEAAAMLILSATFSIALKNVKHIRQGEKTGSTPPAQIVFPLVLLILVFCLVLNTFF